jgi:hypothetical protein
MKRSSLPDPDTSLEVSDTGPDPKCDVNINKTTKRNNCEILTILRY